MPLPILAELNKPELDKLEMEGNFADEYIAKFKNLFKKGEIPYGEVEAMTKFRNELCKGLTAAIYNKENWPNTINKWEEAVQHKVQCFAIIKKALEPWGNNHLSTKQAKWCSHISNCTKQCKKDKVIPMEINATQVRDPKKEAK